jgi:hypothetical protein
MTILFIILALLILWSLWGFFSSRVEHADYQVIRRARDYEIRKYPARIVAQTSVLGSYETALREGFRIVAGYIFGANEKKATIAMTSPVLEQGSRSEKIAMTSPVLATMKSDVHSIAVGMPRSYTLETLPTPTDARIKLIALPEQTFAAVRFSWSRSEARIKKKEAQLMTALSRDGVTTTGSPMYAGYDAPWTPPWMTRHEVMIAVTEKK